MDRRLSINGAAFYYDYKNKQTRAKFVDPIFGALDKLLNVPKSTIKGAEVEINARPVPGLSFTASATYLDAKVKEYTGAIGSQAISGVLRSEEHTSELQSLMRISYAVFCLKKKKKTEYHT